MAAENGLRAREEARGEDASMRPRRMAAENVQGDRIARHRPAASMRPRRMAAENADAHHHRPVPLLQLQ